MPNRVVCSQELNPGSFNDYLADHPELSEQPPEERLRQFGAQWVRFVEVLASEKGLTPEELHRQTVDYRLSDKP